MKPKIRCAIYTRKSSESGLEQEFNSLDAQHEACASYIASQKHEGWELIGTRYNDGGWSGGNMDRPALKVLLADIAADKIDQIVVYKIDRLTRSLADFAKLVEQLDEANASFVSVTQSFNTSTSMGRLTLNVLLSFAQFEREVTAERIRDKIAASKRKGLWMGGRVPFGYRQHDRTLQIEPDDAAIIRSIFDLYQKHDCVVRTTLLANQQGLRAMSPQYVGRDYVPEFTPSSMHYLLKNPVYAGRIRHKNQVFEGLHPAIIAPELFDCVQAQLQRGARRNQGKSRSGQPLKPLLKKIYDESGQCLTSSHTQRKNRRHYYYVTPSLTHTPIERNKIRDGWRLPAAKFEAQIVRLILEHLAEHSNQMAHWLDPKQTELLLGLTQAKTADKADQSSRKTEDREKLLACIQRIDIKPGQIAIKLNEAQLKNLLKLDGLSAEILNFKADFQLRKRGVETRMIIGSKQAAHLDMTLIRNIRKAQQYYSLLKLGESFGQIAHAQQTSKRRVQQLVPLAFLSPKIVKQIASGEQPIGLTSQWLKNNPLPSEWPAQEAIISKL